MEPAPHQSTSSTKKWLIGCGIGCGAIILIIAVFITSGYFFVRDIVNEFKDTEVLIDTLTERYGRVKEYCPDPDGTIGRDRLEAFLRVREATAPLRGKIEGTFEILAKKKETIGPQDTKPKNMLRKLRLGFGVVPQIAEFIKSRSQALLEAGMGLGEYYYIYVITYYSWLDIPPEDGPDFQIVGPDGEESPFHFWDGEEFKDDRRDRVMRWIHRVILPMLRNQLGELVKKDSSAAHGQWRQILMSEIEAMEAYKGRIPWQDGLPAVIEESLRPFKDRLEAHYSPGTNPLEMAIEQR